MLSFGHTKQTSKNVADTTFNKQVNLRQHFEFMDTFWQNWTRDFFPSLLIYPKWQTVNRNLKIGDIVKVQDSSHTSEIGSK